MGKTSTAKYKALETHFLYDLDTAIVERLEPVLEEMLGELFLDYASELECLAVEEKAGTRKLGMDLAKGGSPKELQFHDELLCLLPTLKVDKMLQAILDTAEPDQQSLLELYDGVMREKYRLENMAAAIETAEQYGTAEHADRVKKILNLDGENIPVWGAG